MKEAIRRLRCWFFGHVAGKRDTSPTQMQCVRCGKHGV